MIEHGFQSVVLWTDALFFLLIAASVVGLIHAWRSPPLRASWQRVTRRPTGMAAIVVLLAFLAIGVLDSLHFRAALAPVSGKVGVVYATEVNSVLDLLLARQRSDVERTYSAPLATHSFVKENVERADGGQGRDYARLPGLSRPGEGRLRALQPAGSEVGDQSGAAPGGPGTA